MSEPRINRVEFPGGLEEQLPAAGDEPATQAPEEEPEQAPTPPASSADGPTVAELTDRWQRSVAELDNLRKRYERQLVEARRDERNRVAAEWLPVLDNLELALQHTQADPTAIVEGVRAVREQALAVLSRLGFTRIEDRGERFDPARHEAVQVVEAPDVEPDTVAQVLRPGYAAEEALLRPAVVAVARRRG